MRHKSDSVNINGYEKELAQYEEELRLLINKLNTPELFPPACPSTKSLNVPIMQENQQGKICDIDSVGILIRIILSNTDVLMFRNGIGKTLGFEDKLLLIKKVVMDVGFTAEHCA